MKRTRTPFYFPLMIAILVVFIASCTTNQGNQQSAVDEATMQDTPSLAQIWKTDSILTGSESTLYSAEGNVIYVSCGNTDPVAKDGNGFIALLNPDGSVKDINWVTGLHAPKGMAVLQGKLYVTDIDEMVIIDIAKGEIESKIPVQDAVFLNDAATDGTLVYFSDSRAGVIYSLDLTGNVAAVVKNTEGINGLECFDGHLYALDKEGLKRYDTKEYMPSTLNTEVTGGDGLIVLNDSTFIASRWAGEIYFIKGKKTSLLLDTQAEKSNTADIGYIQDENLVLVPTFMKNEVVAYHMK